MQIDTLDDLELVKKSISGDNDSFEDIVRKYSSKLFYFAKTFGLNDDESKDLVQDSLFKAWKNLKKYNNKYPFKTWIYSITKNTIIDYIRKKKTETFSDLFSDDEEIDFVDDSPSLVDLINKNEASLRVSKAVEKLNDNYRKIILLHYEEEMTFDEIGQLLEKPINTVKSWHFRAIKELKDLLLH